MSLTRSAIARQLEGASRALARGQLRAMAEQLRELWRRSRDPELAQLYEGLVHRPVRGGLWDPSSNLDEGEPTRGRSTDEQRADRFEALARAHAGDPIVLPTLLADPHNPTFNELERLQLLHAWTPDPLLASALARWLRVPRIPDWIELRRPLHGALIRDLAAQRDPRQLETLEQLAALPGLGAPRRRQLRGVISSLGALKVFRLDLRARPEAKALHRRAELHEAERAEEGALLAAVHDAPEDMAARLVYADWLDARGDPRGEFISLQLGAQAGALASATQVREQLLLARHGRRWAGELDALLNPRGRVFEGGFLTRASVEASELSVDQIGLDAWSTLRSLDGHVPDLLALRGRLSALEQLYGFLSLDRFVSLRAAGRLQSVSRYECSISDPNLRFDTPLGLRALLVRHARAPQLARLLSSPAIRGLEELGVYYLGSGQRWVGDHRERAGLSARVQLLRSLVPPSLDRVRMIDERSSRASQPEGCELVFERGREGAPLARLRIELHLYADDNAEGCAEGFAALVRELPALELEAVQLGRIPAQLERAKLDAILARLKA